MPDGRRPVAEVLCDPATAHVYEHGWQSRSPAGRYPVTAGSPRPRLAAELVAGFRPGRPGPAAGFQGEGLLALESEPGGPARLWAAATPAVHVPSIRAQPGNRVPGRLRLLVSADGDVDELAGPSLAAVLAAWADRAGATAGVAATPSLVPGWCARCAYGSGELTGTALAAELAAMDRLGLAVGVVVLDAARVAAGLAEPVLAAGRRAGARLAPTLVPLDGRVARGNPGWLVAGADPGPGLGVLDVTHPGAAAWLRELVAGVRAAGADHLVMDELYASALPGRRHADAAPLAAYRECLRLVAEAAGPGCTLVAAAAPLLPSIGLVHAMATAPEPVAGAWPGGAAALAGSLATARARAWQHGRLWAAAPGCLATAGAAPGERVAWVRHLATGGGLASSGDRLGHLDRGAAWLTRLALRPSSPAPVPWEPAAPAGATLPAPSGLAARLA